MNRPRKTPLYENCKARNLNGDIIFYCNTRKAKWYLDRNLAKIVSQDPFEIQLTFQTNGNGNLGDEFYLQGRENKCVVCGIDKDLSRHHIVPIAFRKHFPDELKSHSYHDVLPLCIECHDRYERFAMEFKRELEVEYNAPLNGNYHNQKQRDDFFRARGYAQSLLKHGDKIPEDRKTVLVDRIKLLLNIQDVVLEEIVEMEIIPADVDSQGKIVVDSLDSLDSLDSFIQRWRKHFVDVMKPAYLPKHWAVGRVAK